MKKVIIALLMVGSVPAFAQKMNPSRVPAPAQSSFSKTHAKVQNVKWEKAEDNYKAVFTEGGSEIKITYNDKGEQIMAEYSMETKQVPAIISQYMAEHYSGSTVMSYSRVQKVGSPFNYVAEIKGKSLLFGPNGQFVKEVTE